MRQNSLKETKIIKKIIVEKKVDWRDICKLNLNKTNK